VPEEFQWTGKGLSVCQCLNKGRVEISNINPRPDNGEDDMGLEYNRNKIERAPVPLDRVSRKTGLIYFSGEFINATDNSHCLEAMPG